MNHDAGWGMSAFDTPVDGVDGQGIPVSVQY